MGRRGRRRKKLLDDVKERRRYWKLKEEELDRALWRTRSGRGCGSVVRRTTGWINHPLRFFIICNSTNESTIIINI